MADQLPAVPRITDALASRSADIDKYAGSLPETFGFTPRDLKREQVPPHRDQRRVNMGWEGV
jgi:hypothetical protein